MADRGKNALIRRLAEIFGRARSRRGPGRVRSIRFMGAQCLFGVALFVLADSMVFGRTGYFRWVAPESSVGMLAVAIDNFRHIPARRDAILAIGDSRVSEGFSAQVAQQVATSQGLPYEFFNAGVPGTTPRVWYYLLRQLHDPQRHLAAVVVMLTTYHDNEPERLADRGGDIAFLHPLLTLADLPDFPRSFPSVANRANAVEAILFKGMFYSADLRNFAAAPVRRVQSVLDWRRHGYDWIRDYPGRAASLSGLAFDPASGMLTLPPGRGAAQTDLLPDYAARLRRYRGRPPDNAAAAAYRRAWLGRIAALCRQAQVRLFVYRVPRGPLDYLAVPDNTTSGVLADMARSGAVELLPADLFTRLERPEFFFDRLHMDRAGRLQFSAMLAQAVLRHLAAAPQVR